MLLLLAVPRVFAAPTHSVDETVRYFRLSIIHQDTKLLYDILDDQIDLTYNNIHSSYAKAQVLMIINDFYAKNKPTSFRVSYRGGYQSIEDEYVIGSAPTVNGVYKIYLYIKKKEGKFLIQELKIGND